MHYETVNDINEALAKQWQGETLIRGSGPLDARVMFVGEAPGADEIETGRPFTGKAGKNFEALLGVLGLSRDEVYVTNTVKYRPWKKGSSGRISNRPPTRSEIEQFMPYLHEEIRLVSPQVIVTLGNTPLHAVTGDFSLKLGDVHGRWGTWNGVPAPVYPLYHPASIIYSKRLHEAYDADLKALRNELVRAGLAKE